MNMCIYRVCMFKILDCNRSNMKLQSHANLRLDWDLRVKISKWRIIDLLSQPSKSVPPNKASNFQQNNVGVHNSYTKMKTFS